MKRSRRASRHQLRLYHGSETPTVMAIEEVRAKVVEALAELLIEALGEESDARRTDEGGADESEDHA